MLNIIFDINNDIRDNISDINFIFLKLMFKRLQIFKNNDINILPFEKYQDILLFISSSNPYVSSAKCSLLNNRNNIMLTIIDVTTVKFILYFFKIIT